MPIRDDGAVASIPNPLAIPDRVLAGFDAAIKLEARSGEIIELANRTIAVLERLIETIDAAAKHVDPLVTTIDAAREKVDPLIVSVDNAAAKAGPLITTLDAALPALEQAVGLAAPLEGSMQRLGQILDSRSGKRGRKDAKDEAVPSPE